MCMERRFASCAPRDPLPPNVRIGFGSYHSRTHKTHERRN
jgi:hypothetical protein